ncbi:MAG: penicillin-binding protein 2 [Xanthobacteraceae bacterium]|nr:penicillin-binding protein 2 [Xanthobacteraceae bacterium]
MHSPAAPTSAPQERALQEPWRRHLVRTLLYGKSVDRAVKARARIGLAIIVFGICYAVIAGRLVMYAATDNTTVRRSYSADAVATARPDILDRNGEILATDVRMPSLFAEPHRIIDKDEAVELLATVIPDLDVTEVRERLSSRRRFVWLRREITAKQRQEVHRLGLPGIGFMHENKRVYPSGPLVSHLIGHVNIDNQGIAGIEKWLDSRGLADLHLAGLARDRLQQPVELAVDIRVQHAMRDELIKARVKYKALAAAGLVLDARTGEIVSMVSVPDYDPNNPREALDPTRINRLTTGVFEMGSTFKALTLAMALDSGRMNLNSTFDARGSLQYGKHTIHDYRGQNRVLSMGEVFTYSSNIGTARMALALGVEHHKQFLRRLGQLDRLRTELPESAEPLVPRRWQEINTVTIAFGHGLSVAPLQAMMANAALVNGGLLIPPTFRKRTEEEAMQVATRVLKPDTSEKMRYLMRLNAEKGSARRADVEGFYVGGKTGTSEKVVNGRYVRNKLLNSFTAVFPADQPRYLLLVMLDEPQVIPETQGYATSGWNAAPTAGLIIARIAPLLAITPRFDLPPAEKLILASAQRR